MQLCSHPSVLCSQFVTILLNPLIETTASQVSCQISKLQNASLVKCDSSLNFGEVGWTLDEAASSEKRQQVRLPFVWWNWSLGHAEIGENVDWKLEQKGLSWEQSSRLYYKNLELLLGHRVKILSALIPLKVIQYLEMEKLSSGKRMFCS